jgi:hypothetical protein
MADGCLRNHLLSQLSYKKKTVQTRPALWYRPRAHGSGDLLKSLGGCFLRLKLIWAESAYKKGGFSVLHQPSLSQVSARRGYTIRDEIAIMGSLDACPGEIDR